MSDISQGPDWWQASDGKWYAPELYPKDWAPPGVDPGPAEVSEPVAPQIESSPSEMARVETPPVAEPVAPVLAADPGQPTEAIPSVPRGAPVEPPEIPVFEPPPDIPVVAAQPPPAAPPIPAQPAPSVPIAEPAVEWPAPAEPLSGWSAPDPAASEPTMVAGMAPVSVDATTVQPAYVPPAAAAPTTWDQPVVPPVGYDTPVAEGAGAVSADLPAGLLGLVGAAALVVGSFLAWAKAGGTLAGGTVNGLTGSNGWGTLVCGLVVAAGAGLLMAGQRKVWVGSGVGAAAVAALALAVFSIIDIGNTSDDLAQVLLDANVDAATANGAVLDLDIGVWIVTAGGAVALLAAIIALARRN